MQYLVTVADENLGSAIKELGTCFLKTKQTNVRENEPEAIFN